MALVTIHDIHIVCLACRNKDCERCTPLHALHKCEAVWNYICSCECDKGIQLSLPLGAKP